MVCILCVTSSLSEKKQRIGLLVKERDYLEPRVTVRKHGQKRCDLLFGTGYDYLVQDCRG